MAYAMENNTSSSLYRYGVELQLVTRKETISIDPTYVKNIVTDYDYKNNNMPLIFMSLTVNDHILNAMIDNQNDATLILNIQKFIIDGSMPGVRTTYIRDTFVYFISDELNNDERRYGRNKTSSTSTSIENKSTESSGQDFSLITIGLMSQNLLNKNKKNIFGTLKGNLSSVLYYATSHLDILMEPVKNNKEISSLIIPPRNSVASTIKYINNMYTIFPTPYRFFMDFDVSYLISSSGNPVLKRGDKLDTVRVNLRNTLSDDAKEQGMRIDHTNGFYSMEIQSADINCYANNLNDKSYTSMKIVSSEGSVKTKDVSIASNSSVMKKEQVIRLPNDNEELIGNIVFNLKSGSRVLNINKCDIDSSVVTINRKYVVNSSDVFKDEAYNGNYILTRKREIFMREDDCLKCNVMLTLEKIVV